MKEAMLVVSFGTTHEQTRKKTIDAIEGKVRAAFPDSPIYSAWTSEVVIRKVRASRGEHHDTLGEALARMAADGVDSLVVVTTCLMDGVEMAKVRKEVSAWAEERGVPAHVADPLLAAAEDRMAVAKAVCDQFAFADADDAVLLMGHGSADASNEVYEQIQDAFRELGRSRFFVATVEGEPTFDDALKLIEGSRARRVHLAPLMIVAGDHAKNDLAGEDPDSWSSKLKERGLEVEVFLKGLGEYPDVQELVCEHARRI